MRKLKLHLEDLAVDSFVAEKGAPAEPGTVHAHGHTKGHDTCYFSCQIGCTAQESCYDPCAQ